MPLVKLFKEVGVHLEQVQGGGIRERGGFHEAKEQEQIVKVVQRAEQLETMEMERVGSVGQGHRGYTVARLKSTDYLLK